MLVQTYPSPDPARRRVPLLPERLHAPVAPAAAASGTTTPTGPTTPRCRRSTAPSRGAADAAGLTNVRTLDLASAFNGRRLCENTVGLYEERGLANWQSPGAVDQTEWVNQIRTVSTCCADSPYYIQESLHPNYWAQLATRSCVRQAWNGGATRGGACSIAGTGLLNGEPRMRLQ